MSGPCAGGPTGTKETKLTRGVRRYTEGLELWGEMDFQRKSLSVGVTTVKERGEEEHKQRGTVLVMDCVMYKTNK